MQTSRTTEPSFEQPWPSSGTGTCQSACRKRDMECNLLQRSRKGCTDCYSHRQWQKGWQWRLQWADHTQACIQRALSWCPRGVADIHPLLYRCIGSLDSIHLKKASKNFTGHCSCWRGLEPEVFLLVQGLTFAEAAQKQPEAWSALCADKEVPGAETYSAVERRASQGCPLRILWSYRAWLLISAFIATAAMR